MEISRKALIITMIVNIVLLAVGMACVAVLKYSVLSLSLYLAATAFVLTSSIVIWKVARDYRKSNS